jgi:hypothetical protein
MFSTAVITVYPLYYENEHFRKKQIIKLVKVL